MKAARRKAAHRRAMIGLSACLLFGLGGAALLNMGQAQRAWESGALALAWMGALTVLIGVVFAGFLFLCYGFLILGWFRLFDREVEYDDMPDDNTVGDPETGERNLQQWLSAANSFESYIGMIPRSEPWVPPKNRPPPDANPERARMTSRSYSAIAGCLAFGASFGVALGIMHGVDVTPGVEPAYGYQPVGIGRLIVCAALGMIAALPPAVLLAALFAKVARDDAGTSSPEAA